MAVRLVHEGLGHGQVWIIRIVLFFRCFLLHGLKKIPFSLIPNRVSLVFDELGISPIFRFCVIPAKAHPRQLKHLPGGLCPPPLHEFFADFWWIQLHPIFKNIL